MVNVLNMHNMKMIAVKRNGDFALKSIESINDNVAIPFNLKTTEIIRDQQAQMLVTCSFLSTIKTSNSICRYWISREDY